MIPRHDDSEFFETHFDVWLSVDMDLRARRGSHLSFHMTVKCVNAPCSFRLLADGQSFARSHLSLCFYVLDESEDGIDVDDMTREKRKRSSSRAMRDPDASCCPSTPPPTCET